MNTGRKISFWILAALLLAPATGLAEVVSTWDDPAAGLDGWSKASVNTTLEYVNDPAICQQGGCIKAIAANTCGFGAPGAFKGDYAAQGYNNLSFDLRILLQQLTGVKPDVKLRYSASFNGWEYKLNDIAIDASRWQSFNVPFDAGWSDAEATAHGWRDLGQPNKSFSETLRHVESLAIKYDYAAVTAVAFAIDNFKLSHIDPAANTVPTDRANRIAPARDPGKRTINPLKRPGK